MQKQTRALILVIITTFSTAFSTTYLFSYIGFLAAELGNFENVNESGYLAGYLSGAMFLGRTFSAPFWGTLSYRYGRRPTLISSAFSVVIFPIMFGLSKNIWFALLARFFLGFFNGTSTIGRTVAAEIFSGQDQAKAMSYYSTAWSFGQIIGPSLSGWTTFVNTSSGNVLKADEDPEFYKRFLWPSIISSALGLLSLILLIFFFEETLVLSKTKANSPEEAEKFLGELDPKVIVENELVCSRNFISVTAAYCSISFASAYANDMLPLWAISSLSEGGLGLGTSEVGSVIAVGGFVSLFSTLLVFNVLSSLFSHKSVFVVGTVCTAISYMSTPILAVNFASYLVLNGIREIFEVVSFNSLFILTNNSVSAKVRGKANGISLSLASICKMLGPITGSIVFAWSIDPLTDFTFVDFKFAFILGTAVLLGTALFSMFVIPGRTFSA